MTTALALVPTLRREHLAFEELDGRSLVGRAVSAASLATGAPVTVLIQREFEQYVHALPGNGNALVLDRADADREIRAAIATTDLVVIHDPLCPLVPGSFISSLLQALMRRLRETGAGSALVAVRPVVETLKRVDSTGRVVSTVDRESVRAVLSPVVTTNRMLAEIAGLAAALADPGLLARELQATGDVQLVLAPESATRVESRAALVAMAASQT